MMKSIDNEADYLYALKAIDRLINQKRRTPIETELLVLLSSLVEGYESVHYPTEIPDALSAIQFRMEQQDLTERDLVPYIGTISKVRRVLSGKRTLSKAMIRKLHLGLGIPLTALQNNGAAGPVAGAERESERGIEL